VANVGRNDPCPCGSGRKYKRCCLQLVDGRRAARTRLRQAEARVVPALLELALDRWGEDFLADAWEEFVLWAEGMPDDLLEDPDFHPLFLPWFVFSYVPDPHAEAPHPDAPTIPIGLVYLSEADDIDDLDRQLIESACAGGFSFYAVERVTPGESITLKDILTGTEVRALEEGGSGTVQEGDILFAHPTTVGTGSILVGCSPLVIPPTWHNRIIDFREEIWPGQRPSAADVLDCDFEIRDFYFDIADALLNPRPPVITNTDGELMKLTALAFDLNCSVQEAFDRLKSLGTAEDDEDDGEVERNPDGTLAAATIRWQQADGPLLGVLQLSPWRLSADVNSAERAARLREEIASRLGDRAVYTGSQETTVEDLLAETEAAPEAPAAGDETPDPALEALESELTAAEWEKWVDEQVPALGNETPRDAAKTALGRERLEALFAEFAWRGKRQPAHMRVNVAALREKLGI